MDRNDAKLIIRVPKEIKLFIEKQARKENRSMSSYARLVFKGLMRKK